MGTAHFEKNLVRNLGAEGSYYVGKPKGAVMERSEQAVSDRELMEDFAREGREESFNLLVQRHKAGLFNVAYRVLYDRHAAEDVVQRVFIRAVERKTELTEVESLRSWLYKTALNLSLKMKQRARSRSDREKAVRVSPSPESPRDAAARAEQREELELALRKLKDELRLPLVFRYLQGMSQAETGEIMSLSPDATRMRINRALKKLRGLLKKRGLLMSLLALEEALRSLPAEGVSANFLASATSIVKAASAAGAAAKAAITTTAVAKGGLAVTAKAKIAIGAGVVVILAGSITYFATRVPERTHRAPRAAVPRASPQQRREKVIVKADEREPSVTARPAQKGFLWGHVVDAAGKPLPGALVEAGVFEGVSPDYLTEKRLVQGSVTDSNGEFRFSEKGALNDATLLLEKIDRSLSETLHSLLVVSKEGFLATRREVNLSSPSSPYRIVLKRPPQVNGIVVWEETMEPIAGIQVACTVRGSDVDIYETPDAEDRTEEDGTFTISVHAEGGARVQARFHEPYASCYASKPTEAEITLVAGEAIPNVVLTVQRGSATIIEGKVLDAWGNPVVGAKVQLSTDKNASDPGVSREDGGYRLIVAKVWPYQSYFLEGWPEKPAVSVMGEGHWGTFVVPEGCRDVLFSGPYPSSVTMVEGGEKREWNPEWTPPSNAPPERLVAIHDDYQIGIVGVPLLGPGQIRRDVDIFLRKGTRVSGKVVDNTYQPLAGAEITIEVTSEENPVLIENDNKFIREQKIISEEEGSFEICFLREGSYRLTASHPDCARQKKELQLQPGQAVEGFDFVLARSVGFIRGRVLDKYGFPWPYGRVQTYVHDGTELVRECAAEVEEDGTYELTKLDPGKYSLRLEVSSDFPEPEGILWATALRNTSANTEGNDVIVMELPAGSLRVRVVDRANLPVEHFDFWGRPLRLTYGANAIIQDKYSGALYESPSTLKKRNRAGRPGEFFLQKVAPGRYSISVTAHRYGTSSQEVEIEAGRETDATFVLGEVGEM